MTFLSITVLTLGLLMLFLFPLRSSVAKFYLLGVLLFYPAFWMIGVLLNGDAGSVNNPSLITILLLIHTLLFVISIIIFWSILRLEGRFQYSIEHIKKGHLDTFFTFITFFVYGITLFRFYMYGFLISGVTPALGIQQYFELPYLDTILLAFQGVLFPAIIIWPLLRLSHYYKTSQFSWQRKKFKLLILLAFLLSFSFGRTATIMFLLFIFLFQFSYTKIRVSELLKKIIIGFIIIVIAAPAFHTVRLHLNSELSNRELLLPVMLKNIGVRTMDIINFTDDILDSQTVGNGGPYLVNSYKRLVPSFLLENCSSYDCPSKVSLEKAVLKAMNLKYTDKTESFFIATLVDKSVLSFVFYPLLFALLISLELLAIAKLTHRNSGYFILAYCHIGYSLLKIEADSAWFLFHIRDSLLLFSMMWVIEQSLKKIHRNLPKKTLNTYVK